MSYTLKYWHHFSIYEDVCETEKEALRSMRAILDIGNGYPHSLEKDGELILDSESVMEKIYNLEESGELWRNESDQI